MDTHIPYKTARLIIDPFSIDDKEFILKLVNTPGWKSFIGNRNINSEIDAAEYIRKITENPDTTYWTVKLKENKTSIGIITLIKRHYLRHRDIGFAFLPEYCNKGYAFEATTAVLNHITKNRKDKKILATTIPENVSSIKLLEKLGMKFKKEINVDGKNLNMYIYSANRI